MESINYIVITREEVQKCEEVNINGFVRIIFIQ